MRVSDLSSASVEPLLQGRLGSPYRFVVECPSTQHLLGPDDTEGTTVATDLQTQGRGRLGRTWETPPGRALLFSVLLHPRPPMAIWPELSLVAGDAVATALREETEVAAELSHPNDVNQTDEELPADTPKPPTSLRIETGREWPRAPLLAAILLELERRYDDWQRLHTNR